MNSVFHAHLGKSVLVYLDDILIMSKNITEHIGHVRTVLVLLREHKLYAKLSKCSFCSPELNFLGHVISAEGIKVDPAKTAVVRAWPKPKTLKELQAFLGLANYFRRFIPGYGTMSAPLTSLTSAAHASFNWDTDWDDTHESAFQAVKSALSDPAVLQMPDFTKPFEVRTDASCVGTGGVLMQDGKPVAYCSQKLSPAEKNYTTTEQELLALIHACRAWRCYLESDKPVTLVTDHHPLTFLKTQPLLSRRQARWLIELQRFHFEITYIPGASNTVADALSRSPHLSEGTEPTDPFAELNVITRSSKRSISFAEDTVFEPPPLAGPPLKKKSHTLRLVKPPSLEEDLTEGDSYWVDRLLDAYRDDPLFSDPDYLANVTKNDKGLFLSPTGQILVPSDTALRFDIIGEFHCPPTAGHISAERTLHSMKQYFQWGGMNTDTHTYIMSCESCQRVKSSNRRKHGAPQALPIPTVRWESVTFDLITKLPESDGFDSICVFVDRLTKMTHFVACKESMTAADFAQLFIDNIVRLHGLPAEVISDRGIQWNNEFWKSLCSLLKIKHKMSSAYHPQTDGQTERMNRTLEEMLRAYIPVTGDNWSRSLACAEFAINNAKQASTKETPFFLNYGYTPHTPITLEFRDTVKHPSVKSGTFAKLMADNLIKAKRCLEIARNNMLRQGSSTTDVKYDPGDLVLLSTRNFRFEGHCRKLMPKWVGPFSVDTMTGPVNVKLVLHDDWKKLHPVFHVNLVKRYTPGHGYRPPPPPVSFEEGEPVFIVESILDHSFAKAPAVPVERTSRKRKVPVSVPLLSTLLLTWYAGRVILRQTTLGNREATLELVRFFSKNIILNITYLFPQVTGSPGKPYCLSSERVFIG